MHKINNVTFVLYFSVVKLDLVNNIERVIEKMNEKSTLFTISRLTTKKYNTNVTILILCDLNPQTKMTAFL